MADVRNDPAFQRDFAAHLARMMQTDLATVETYLVEIEAKADAAAAFGIIGNIAAIRCRLGFTNRTLTTIAAMDPDPPKAADPVALPVAA